MLDEPAVGAIAGTAASAYDGRASVIAELVAKRAIPSSLTLDTDQDLPYRHLHGSDGEDIVKRG